MNYKTLFEDILNFNANDTKVTFLVSGETPSGDRMDTNFETEDLQEAMEEFARHRSIYTHITANIYYKEEWLYATIILTKNFSGIKGLLVDADVYQF